MSLQAVSHQIPVFSRPFRESDKPAPTLHLPLTRLEEPAPKRPMIFSAAAPQVLHERLQENRPRAASEAARPPRAGAWGWAANQVGKGSGAYQSTSESYQEDGINYEKTTQTGPKGYVSTTVTYEKDGVSYVETTTSSNGTTNIRVEATSGDVTEVTTTSTSTLPGELGDYIDPGMIDYLNLDPEGPAGAPTRTQVQTQVIDNSQNPPLVTTTQQSTTYSQQVGSLDNLESGESVYLPEGSQGGAMPLAFLPEGTYDQNKSGTFVSFTTREIPVQNTTLTAESRVVGTGVDGQPLLLSASRDVTVGADGQSQTVLHYQERGTISREDAENQYLNRMWSNDVSLADQFTQTDSKWLDFDQTTVYTDGEGMPVVTSQFGELDRPGQDSVSATSVRDGSGSEFVTLNRVSQDGKRLQTETHIPGTDYLSTSDTRYGSDGEYTTESSTYAGDLMIGSSQSSHRLVFAAGERLPAQAPAGFDPELWKQFVALHPQGPVYMDELNSSNLNQDGVTTSVQSSAYQAGNSTLRAGTQTTGGEQHGSQQLLVGGEQPVNRLILDGMSISVNGDGLFEIDGETFELPAELASHFLNGQTSLADLRKALGAAPGLMERFPDLGPLSDKLGVLFGGLDLLTADGWSDRAAATSGVLGGVSGWTYLKAMTNTSKWTGAVGGGLQIGLGAWEIFSQHNYAEGIVDAVGGGAAVAGVLLAATNPVLAATLGAVVFASSVTRWILDWGDEDKHGAYDFEGDEPDWKLNAA